MKTIYCFIALALAGCLMLAACEKEETNNNIVTVNDVTYEKVEASVDDSHNGLYFTFVLTEDGKTTADAMIDFGIALEKTLKYNLEEEGNGGYGDWMCLSVIYPNDKYYSVEPASGTQTIKKQKNGYSVVIDGKDSNGKDFKMNLVAKVVKK
jgi:hypothetical protein